MRESSRSVNWIPLEQLVPRGGPQPAMAHGAGVGAIVTIGRDLVWEQQELATAHGTVTYAARTST